MKTSWIIDGVIVVIIVIGAWYAFSNYQSPATPSAAMGTNGSANQGNLGQPDTGQVQQPMADGAEGVVIGSNLALGTDGNTALGTYLIGYTGMTVYTKDGDAATTSTCYGTCAESWPPYVVGAEDNVHQVKAGVSGNVDTFIRTDGGIQVTYNGKPLYFYIGDKTNGGATGEGIGGVWHVAKP